MAGTKTVKVTYITAAVNTSSSAVVSVNNTRRYLLIQNVGTVDVYVNFGAPATADTDSLLFKADGYGILVQDDVVDGNSINAITASGTGQLRIGEY